MMAQELPKDVVFFSVVEVANFWRVSCRVVRHQIDKGALPAKRIGREYRIHRAALETYGEFSATS